MPKQRRDDDVLPELIISGERSEMTLACAGDLEGEAAASLRGVAVALIAAGSHRLSIKASAVTFMDCAGIAALVAVRLAAASAGAEFALVDPSRAVVRILRLAGLGDAFGITAAPDGIAA